MRTQYHLGGYIVGGDKDTYAPQVWDWMIDNNIKSVIDIGCGEGHSTKYFYDHNIDILGIEGSSQAIQHSPIKDKIICHDYTLGPIQLSKRYDAVWSCEFVEHIDARFIENFLNTFDYANHIFMTHATPGQGGYHHVNEQPSSYWIEKISARNYSVDMELSLELRQKTSARWVKKSLLVFHKKL